MSDCIVPDWPGMPASVGALSTTRRGGVSGGPYGNGKIDGAGGGLNLGLHVGDFFGVFLTEGNHPVDGVEEIACG